MNKLKDKQLKQELEGKLIQTKQNKRQQYFRTQRS